MASRCAVAISLALLAALELAAQTPPANYRTRRSVCRYERPRGRAIDLPTSVSAVETSASAAEQVATYATSVSGLAGGEIVACTEYGLVEIADSDDDKLRIQVRLGASGDGHVQPVAAARHALEQTSMRVYAYALDGKLLVHVWNDTLGFVEGTAQPVSISIRIHVPAKGAYRVATEAYHGPVAIRRLTVAGGVMRARSGDKFKGIAGYLGNIDLDNVTLGGDLDISSDGGPLSPPLLAKLRVVAPSRLTVSTGAEVNIAVAPEPTLGIRAFGASNDGAVSILFADAVKRDTTTTFASYALFEQQDFATKPLRFEVRVTTVKGKVNIASVPASR
jgi:hypothetical protein